MEKLLMFLHSANVVIFSIIDRLSIDKHHNTIPIYI